MMHTERKTPWVRGEVPGKESPPKSGREGLKGLGFEEGEKALAPEPEPQRNPGLSQEDKESLVQHLRRDVGSIQESAALARTLQGAASDFRRQSKSLATLLRATLPGLAGPAGRLEASVDALCGVAEANQDMEPPEELMESYNGAREEYQEEMRLRGKYFGARRDRDEMKEEGNKIGAFFAKNKMKSRAKKVKRQQGKVETSRAKLEEQKAVMSTRLRQLFSGARAALDRAVEEVRAGLEQAGANPPDMSLIGESVERGLINAIMEMLVPEGGIRRA